MMAKSQFFYGKRSPDYECVLESVIDARLYGSWLHQHRLPDDLTCNHQFERCCGLL